MKSRDGKHLAHLVCFGERCFVFQFLDSEPHASSLHAQDLNAALRAVLRMAAKATADEIEQQPTFDGLLCAAEILAGFASAMQLESNVGGDS